MADHQEDPIVPSVVDLLMEWEGLDQPADVPPGDSGVSIGVGYDLGQETTFHQDWSPHLPADWMSRLSLAVGKRGAEARACAHTFHDIHVALPAARAVFLGRTLPREITKARAAFPGWDHAPSGVRGATLSVGYNRGFGMEGSSRLEMRQIRDAVRSQNWHVIPAALRRMKRIWPNDVGLQHRREAEARLAESGLAH